MKKLALILAAFVALAGNPAYAQNARGAGASQARSASSDFAWGAGLVGLAIIGVVVGITAAAASSSPSTFSHN